MKYIIDLDGTLLSGDTANLDSVAFMNHLNATNTDYLVMTKVTVNNETPDIILLLDFEKESDKLQEVFHLINKGTPVITASKSNYYLKNEERVLDTGAFTSLLEAASEITIEVFGKPSSEYFKSGLSLLNTSPNEVMVIGDDWKTDVKGAMSVGCKSALLKSGKYNEGDALRVPETLCLDRLMDIFTEIKL